MAVNPNELQAFAKEIQKLGERCLRWYCLTSKYYVWRLYIAFALNDFQFTLPRGNFVGRTMFWNEKKNPKYFPVSIEANYDLRNKLNRPFGMASIVLCKTACTVAIVDSSASLKLDLVAVCARNRDANKSPTPVNWMPAPMTGICRVILCSSVPVKRRWYITLDAEAHESQKMNLPFLWLKNDVREFSVPRFVEDSTTVFTPFSWNQFNAVHASVSLSMVMPVNSSASNWFGVQMSLNGIISFW